MAEKQPEYFLGAVVTIRSAEEESRIEVIDGQQRLATVSLLYAALRDLFASHNDVRAAEIQAKFLGEMSFGTRALTQYLELNADDNDTFRQLTLVPVADRGLQLRLASNKRLKAAYDFFDQKFHALTDGLPADTWATPVVEWYDFVWQKALILEVSVPNESRGFVIFETLNDRGLNLSTADLLKNHLFGKAGTRIAEVKARWARAVAPFEDPDSKLDLDTFLRQFWASRKGVVRVKGLFSLIKPEVGDEAAAVGLADDLAEASAKWTAMFEPGSDAWRGYSAGSVAALESLRNLNVEQCRPLLLAALLRLPRRDVEELLRAVVNWSVRWLVVGGGSAGTTERLYAETAQKITDRTITDAAGVRAAFDPFVPSDLAFERAFEVESVRRGWLARYYLTVLERAAMGTTDPELVPNQDVDQVNLEHVLPKTPDPSWATHFSPDEAQQSVYLIGNQCLLAKTHNSTIGNQSFAVKKPILAASQLSLTTSIGALLDWTPTSIRDRQADLAKLAPMAWPRT
jgi:hypothetical protein